MRADLRPYWLKKLYLNFRHWYAEYFLRPECASLGPFHTIMKPWYVSISGNNIHIGRCLPPAASPATGWRSVSGGGPMAKAGCRSAIAS